MLNAKTLIEKNKSVCMCGGGGGEFATTSPPPFRRPRRGLNISLVCEEKYLEKQLLVLIFFP